MYRPLPLAAALIALTLSSCKHAVPDKVAATVNGRPIGYADLDKQYQTNFMSSGDKAGEKAGEDQAQIQKIELLRTMIDNEIMLQRAEKLGLMATDADVDAKIAELKAPYTQEDFQRQLAARHMTLDDLKTQLKKNLSVTKLFNKEITSHIAITDKDVGEFYAANKSSFNFPEPQVRMATILVTPNPDANVRNLKNDKAQNDDQAKQKIEMILARLRQGDDFASLAQNFSEDANSRAERGRPRLRRRIYVGARQHGPAQGRHGHGAGADHAHHSHGGRVSHPEGFIEGGGGAARIKRSAGAAEHPRDSGESQGSVVAGRLL